MERDGRTDGRRTLARSRRICAAASYLKAHEEEGLNSRPQAWITRIAARDFVESHGGKGEGLDPRMALAFVGREAYRKDMVGTS